MREMLGGHPSTVARWWSGRGTAIAAAVVGLCAVWLVVWNVGAWRGQVLTGDEVILLSASESLVERGRPGAPIFSGVYGAGERQFMWPPVEHLLHWPVMKVFGATVESGRAVALACGLTILVGASALARRMGGSGAAAAIGFLLVFWRTGLIGTGWGIPLVTISRSIRYDVVVTAWVVLGMLALEWWLRSGRRTAGMAVGLLSAAAILTHWIGLLLPAATVAAWLLQGRQGRPGVRAQAFTLAWVVAGLAPWAWFAAAHATEFTGQWGLVHGWRMDAAVGALGTVVRNLLAEPIRYAGVLEAGGPGAAVMVLAVLVMIRPGTVYRDSGRPIIAVVYGTLIVGLLLLALFEPTKSPLYALVLQIPLAIGLAVAASNVVRSGVPVVRWWVALLALVMLGEGVVATVRDVRAARLTRPYAEIAAILSQARSTGSATGPQRWWWSLREPGYVPVATLVLRWEMERRRVAAASFVATWREAGITNLVWSPEQEADQSRWPLEVREFLDQVRTCMPPAIRIADATWGPIELIHVTESCATAARR